VERQVRTEKQYQVTVRFDDGTTRSLTRSTEPAWRQGDRVRVIGDDIQPAPAG